MSFKQNLILEQGTSFSNTILIHNANGSPLTFSNTSTANSVMKKSYFSNTSYAFGVTLSNTVGITLTMAANVTANIWPNNYVYDILVTDSNTETVTRIVEGQIQVTGAVTNQILVP